MEELLPFLVTYENWIYIFLGAIAFVYLRKLVSAWKDWQGTVFGLERDFAQRRFSSALTVLILLVLFVFMEFVIVSFVVPNNPQVYAQPTSTLDLLATPTVTLPVLVQAVTAEVTGEVEATPTVMTAPEGCIPGQIEWTFPQPGQEIRATIELKGTVNVPNLGFYKYEIQRPGSDIWEAVAAGNQPRVDGTIGFLNTSTWEPGDYMLRLVVADNQNQLFPACVIPVRVSQP